jgi:hypothetical protein
MKLYADLDPQLWLCIEISNSNKKCVFYSKLETNQQFVAFQFRIQANHAEYRGIQRNLSNFHDTEFRIIPRNLC